MEDAPHLLSHFMAASAEKHLEDYHFLRNTYETINGQEIQLNRILRMLGEDEFNLNWRGDLLPVGRSRARSAQDFDRWSSSLLLKGNIAYERLRELEQESKTAGQTPVSFVPRRVQELRQRRQRLSEQRDYSSTSNDNNASSSSRLRALEEYDTALAESETRRKRQAEQNRTTLSSDEEKQLAEKRQERLNALLNNDNSKYEKSKQKDDESTKRLNENRDKQNVKVEENNLEQSQRISTKHNHDNNLDSQENSLEKNKKTSNEYGDQENNLPQKINEQEPEKTSDIELISLTVRCQPLSSNDGEENSSLIRLKCQWASPSSSSAIDYFTIERQLGDSEWLSIGEKINKHDNHAQLDVAYANDENNPSYFRLKAHLQNGQTFTSKITDAIFMNLLNVKHVIVPDVEILSTNSVQLTWNDDENEDKNKSHIYDVEKKEEQQPEWEKVTEVPLSQRTARIDSLSDPKQCQFRLIESDNVNKSETEIESKETLTVRNVNDLINSLHIVPTSPTTVTIDISDEGFKEFDSYQIEYTTEDNLNQWKKIANINHTDPYSTVNNLKPEANYKFRFIPISSETRQETNSSQLSLILDVIMPSKQNEQARQNEDETSSNVSPQFSIQKLDPTSVLIEAKVPNEEAKFEDVYDIFSKKEIPDDDWTKVGTIDKENLSATIEDLEEDTSYAFKIENTTSPSTDDGNQTVQEFKVDTKPTKKYDPSVLLEKIEQSLESIVNGAMEAAAGHQALEEPINKSLNEVIKEVFRDESLVPNEEFGFDTLALSDDLQLYRGPKQMMLKELEIDETNDSSKHYGEIIIHNYRTSQHSVTVREEKGNTHVANIDGDVIIRNVISDVILKPDQSYHQLSMNIVGQAFLKAVQGSLMASNFKGIIVVKNVNKP